MRVKGMKKAQAKERMLFIVGVILICLLALVFVVRFIFPSLETSREGQAKVLANMIAVSVNTLYTMDQGQMYKDFGFKEPLIVEITNEGGVSTVKVVYDEVKGGSYSMPLLVNVDSLSPIRVQAVSVIKDITGKIRINGEILDMNYQYTDVQCAEPSPEQKANYIEDAAKEFGVETAFIKAVIRQESGFVHCKNGYILTSSKGALGLMQLMPKTASGLGVNPVNPKDNIRGGTKFLSQLSARYKGDKRMVLGAYNCGPGHIDNLTRDYGNNWEANLAKECIASETSKFIADVMNFYTTCYASGSCDPKRCVVC